MKKRNAIFLAFLMMMAAAATAHAASSGIWTQYGAAAFFRGEMENISMTSEGVLKLGLNPTRIMDFTEPYVWTIVRDSKGNIYAGTGNKAMLFRYSGSGRAQELALLPGVGITALAIAKDNTLYAGVFPTGEIYKIKTDGTRELVTSLGVRYIWALKLDAGGSLIAATGAPAGLMRITPDGETTSLLQSPESHILCMDMDEKGIIYAGSSPEGLVYRVDPAAKTYTVLYDLDEEEAYRILYLGGGQMLVVANSDQNPTAPPAPAAGQPGANQQQGFDEPISFPIPYKPPQGVSTTTPSVIYKLKDNGDIKQVFSLPDPFILSLFRVDETRFLAGTGNRGNIYMLDLETEKSALHPLPVRQVLDIIGDGRKQYFATGNPGAVYTLESTHTATGTYTSPVNDTFGLASWGNLWSDASVPKGTRLEFLLRTGNTLDPEDGSWSQWSQPITSLPAHIPSPAGRFIQYQARFFATDTTQSPELRDVNIAYLTANKPPVIMEFNVSPQPLRRQPPQKTNGKSDSGGGDAAAAQETNIAVGAMYARQEIGFAWKAQDPDSDQLKYTLHFRRLPDTQWSLLVDEYFGADFRWSTESVPDGRYEIRLTADDSPGNPEDRTKTDEKISDPFYIDNTRPDITADVRELSRDALFVSGAVSDPTSIIAALEYSIDNLEWKVLFPEDQIFDSTGESFRFELAGLAPGQHTVIVRARDFVGNTSSISIPFTVK